jgi:hypothetical protein
LYLLPAPTSGACRNEVGRFYTKFSFDGEQK